MAIRKPASSKPPRERAKRKPKRELSMWETLAAIAAKIPPEELARHPRDGARNLHHYLYGAPKQD